MNYRDIDNQLDYISEDIDNSENLGRAEARLKEIRHYLSDFKHAEISQNLVGWKAGCALVGGLLGAFVGLVGAIPGIAIGWTFAGSVRNSLAGNQIDHRFEVLERKYFQIENKLQQKKLRR